jgi:hypothetical protein
MIKIYSRNDVSKLCHIIVKKEDINKERIDIIPEDNFLQLSTLNLKDGKTFRPHRHIWKDGEQKVIAQESWVVIEGQVIVTYYDYEGSTPLANYCIGPGDCSITLLGGHTYEAVGECKVYEFKTGPYKGQKLDKRFIDE